MIAVMIQRRVLRFMTVIPFATYLYETNIKNISLFREFVQIGREGGRETGGTAGRETAGQIDRASANMA